MSDELRLIKYITARMQEYGMPEFKDYTPALDILGVIRDAGYSLHPPCNHVELDREDVLNVLNVLKNNVNHVWIIDGIEVNECRCSMKHLPNVADAICAKFSQPKIKLPSENELVNIISNECYEEYPKGCYLNAAQAILQHIKEINGVKE